MLPVFWQKPFLLGVFLVSLGYTLFIASCPRPDFKTDLVARAQTIQLERQQAKKTAASTNSLADLPATKQLIIESIGLRTDIYQTARADDMNRGVWVDQAAAMSPDDLEKNLILTAHRWSYRFAKPFFNLDEVKIGDAIWLFWDDKKYRYQVEKIETVETTETAILNQGPRKIVLYTCSPIFSTDKRLVVVANLLDAEKLF